MNKVKGYINILITISVILVVLGLIFPTPVRGNLYDLIFAIYSLSLIHISEPTRPY